MSDKVDDPLKELTEITQPDCRQRYFNNTLELNHEELTSITLHTGVPVEVRQLFETAKNVSLYSWFVYRFHQISELVAFGALEMALRLRYESECECPNKKKSKLTLYPLLQYAKEHNWITNEGFPSLESRVKECAGKRKNDRRALAHDFETEPEMYWEEPTEEEIAEAHNDFDLVSAIAGNAHNIRNELAHGSSQMHPHSISTLHTVGEVINQLYD